MSIEVYAGKMRSVTVWPTENDEKVGEAPEEVTISKGDFTATQFAQDYFPFMLAKRVVLSRPRETYRPGQVRFNPDELLFFVSKRKDHLVTINTFPKSAGPSRSFWQYDVDLDKQSAVCAMRSMQQADGKPDVVFSEWSIEYLKDGSGDWRIANWVELQHDVANGKLLNRNEMKVTNFKQTFAHPKFSHDIPNGQRVQSVTYPEYNPSDKEHRIVETIDYRDPSRSRVRLYLAVAGGIFCVLALAFFVRRRFLKPRYHEGD
jgi:hypothetical protein